MFCRYPPYRASVPKNLKATTHPAAPAAHHDFQCDTVDTRASFDVGRRRAAMCTKDGVVLTIIAVIALGAILVWWTGTPARSFSAAEANSTAGNATAEQPAPKSEAAAKTGPVVAKAIPIPKPPAPIVEQAPATVVETAASPAPIARSGCSSRSAAIPSGRTDRNRRA